MLYFSPGRINLIGEHTDYNGGCVLPGAIDKGILAEIGPNGTGRSPGLFGKTCKAYAEFGLNEGADKPEASWAHYIFGVCREMLKRGARSKVSDTQFFQVMYLLEPVFHHRQPYEECTFAFALNEIYKAGFDKKELVLIGQKTEHHYCGVNCGIMDQFASVFGKAGNLIRLDCSTMEYEYIPFDPQGYKLVLIDSVTKHENWSIHPITNAANPAKGQQQLSPVIIRK